MARHGLGLTGGFLVAALGTTLVVGCGDDGGSDEGDGGDGGFAGSRAGSGGTKAGSGGVPNGGSSGSGTSGSATAGTAPGEAGTGGSGLEPIGGSGGEEQGGEGGTGAVGGEPPLGGEGGGNSEPLFNPKKLNGPNGMLISQVNELRGLTFSSTGKLYASGHVGAFTGYPGGTDRQLAVLRFNADGTLDSSWDGDGVKTLNLRGRIAVDENISNDGDEYSLGVVELTNGDIVVQANVRDQSGKGRDVLLLKLSSSGALVNWSGGGNSSVRKVDFGWKDADNASFPNAPAQPVDEAWGLAVDSSGAEQKLVISGYGSARKLTQVEIDGGGVQRTDNDRYVVRVSAATGLVDATFNGGAPYTFNSNGTTSDGGRRPLVEADGSIVAAGYSDVGSGNTIFALRLKPDGTPDPDFQFKANVPDAQPALPGVAIVNPFAPDGGGAECYAVAKQSTGGYITTGYGRATKDANTASTFADGSLLSSENVDAISLRLTKSGTGGALDTTFGLAGALVFQSEDQPAAIKGNAEDRARDVTVIAGDRLAYGGRFGANPAIFLATANGEADPAQGGLKSGPDGADTLPGIYTYKPLSGNTSHFFRIVASPDGKRVAAVSGNHADGALLAIVNVE